MQLFICLLFLLKDTVGQDDMKHIYGTTVVVGKAKVAKGAKVCISLFFEQIYTTK